MKIKKISLTKFRLFDSLVLEFPNSNCITLIGENGGGKSSVLDAISLGLDFFTGKLRSLTNEYSDLNNLKREDIKIGSNEAKVEITFDNNLSVNIHRSIGQYQSLYFTNSNDTVLSGYRSSLKADTIDSLPLLCYYRINRIITFENQSKSLEYSSSYHEMLEAYYNAFDGKLSSFQDFKRWFINQENLENERKIDEGKLHYQLPSLKVVRDSIIHFF
ncbi:MAG: AAA family ATPase, partial [Bacteroidota bacterium]